MKLFALVITVLQVASKDPFKFRFVTVQARVQAYYSYWAGFKGDERPVNYNIQVRIHVKGNGKEKTLTFMVKNDQKKSVSGQGEEDYIDRTMLQKDIEDKITKIY